MSFHIAMSGERRPIWMFWCSVLFTLAFFLEVGLKIWFLGPFVVRRENKTLKKSNVFDLVILAGLLFETLMTLLQLPAMDVGSGRVFRLFRVLRVTRILRHIGHFIVLRRMLASLVVSAKALAWAIVLLWVLAYILALLILQSVEHRLRLVAHDDMTIKTKQLIEHFGGLGRTMTSLFMSTTGGMDWSECVEVLAYSGWVAPWLFMLFVATASLGVISVVTGAVAQKSSDILRFDKDVMIRKALKDDHQKRQLLRELFVDQCQGSGLEMKRDQFEMAFNAPEQAAFLQTMGLVISRTENLFDLVDTDNNDKVNTEEFVNGLMRRAGASALADGTERLSRQIEQLMEKLNIDPDIARQNMSSSLTRSRREGQVS